MRLPAIFQLRTFLVLAIGLGCGYVSGQNLVLNPGFEEYRDSFPTPHYIDTNWVNQSSCTDWWVATYSYGWHWKEITGHSVNIWNISPRSGRAWVTGNLFLTYFRKDPRTFFQTKLASPLEAGCSYEVRFYVRPYRLEERLHHPFLAFAKDMGAYLSTERIIEYHSYHKLVQYKPQVVYDKFINDTTGFTKITGTMIADGGEQYLTIGFFKSDSKIICQMLDGTVTVGLCDFNFQMDDVSVRKVPAYPEYSDLLPSEGKISTGDTLKLSTGVGHTQWSTGSIGEEISVTTPGKYWYTIEEPCFTYHDTIIVKSEELVLHIPNAFTPNEDGLNDQLEFWIYGVKNFRASVYDRWGQMIYEQEGGAGKFSWDGKVNGREAMQGVYILQIIADGEQQVFEKVHLIR